MVLTEGRGPGVSEGLAFSEDLGKERLEVEFGVVGTSAGGGTFPGDGRARVGFHLKHGEEKNRPSGVGEPE